MKNNHQIIYQDDKPAFVVVPYDEYQRARGVRAETYPKDVVDMQILKGYSPIKAWRIYLKKSQVDLANALGVTQSAVSQLESSDNPSDENIVKVADYLSISVELLDYS